MNNLFSAFSKYFRALLKPMAFVLLYLSIYFAAQIVVTVIYSITVVVYLMLTSQPIYGAMDIILRNTTTAILISILLSLPIYFIIVKIRRQNFSEVLRFNKTKLPNLGLSLVLGTSMNIFISYILVFLERVAPLESISREYDMMMEKVMDGNFIIIFVTIGIMAPIIEEIIFRGLVLSELKKAVPAYSAIIIQALIFGIYHLNLVQGVYAALLGIVLGIVTEKAGSLWAPILIHMSFNIVSTLISKVPINIPEGHFLSNPLHIFLLSIVLMVVSFVLIWRVSGRRSNAFSE